MCTAVRLTQEMAVDFWTKRVGFEVWTRRPLGALGSWIEIAPPGAESCLVLYPKALLSDWAQRKSSIVFDCDDVHAAVARMKVRRDVLAGADDYAVGPVRGLSTSKATNMGCAAARKSRRRRSRQRHNARYSESSKARTGNRPGLSQPVSLPSS